MTRTIAEDIRAGTSTNGRVIYGPNGLFPSEDDIAPQILTLEQAEAERQNQATLERDHKRYRLPEHNPEKGNYAPSDLPALRAKEGLSTGKLARKLGIPRKTLLRKMKGFDIIKARTLSGSI
jgi:DNA-binding NtrC family response regulator